MQDRYAGDDRENAAVAAQDAVVNFSGVAAMVRRRHEFYASAAIRAPEEVECLEAHSTWCPPLAGRQTINAEHAELAKNS